MRLRSVCFLLCINCCALLIGCGPRTNADQDSRAEKRTANKKNANTWPGNSGNSEKSPVTLHVPEMTKRLKLT